MSVSEKKYYRRRVSSSYVTSVISITLVLVYFGLSWDWLFCMQKVYPITLKKILGLKLL